MSDEARNAALIEFISTFSTISENLEEISDLSDGVALFEALSEIAPDYFDPTTIARHLGDNWALKASNLRKMIRNLESYYHNDLKKDADFSIELQKITREGDADAISTLTELVAAAAVTCPDKSTYVQRIMSMTPDSQMAMKGILEKSLARLSDYDDETDEGDENELVFGESMDESAEDVDGDKQQLFGNHDLDQQLEGLRKELAAAKSQAAEAAEESVTAQSKLQALVADLQDRLMKRQDELIQVEEELQTATADLAETRSRLAEVEELKVTLEDDLDVAKGKMNQLYKAEATVVAYKKKLEGVVGMNQQMEGLESQAEKYLQQIMELEAEVKKSNALQKNVSALEEKVSTLEKERDDTANSAKSLETEIADLKTRLSAAENAKKTYEEELSELRAKLEVAEATDAVEAMSIGSAPSNEQREMMMRLEIENKKLREQVVHLSKVAAPIDGSEPIAIAVASPDDTPETTELKVEIQRLFTALSAKEKENAKISSDKDKLEAYTKRTLAKFQDKYLVALQECKAKLKEKQDKIEMLEKRSQSERTAQKREERLLSSSIYELGLGIMQNKLKASAAASGGGGS